MVYQVRNISFPSNTYVIKNNENSDCLIIDPGIDEKLLFELIEKEKLNPVAVLCTHGHFDHIANVSICKENFEIPFFIHEKDKKTIRSANFFLKLTKINFKIKTPVPDHFWIEDDIQVDIKGFKLNIKLFGGHSPGSCVIQYGENLFSGDLLYKNGLGFNSFPDEDKLVLKKSLKEIFKFYPSNSRLYPGHGPSEILGNIKANNTALAEFLNNEN